ncbi:roadblock/LC7 domain-containing protein [Streptomyces litchfieldiae]|uniref:Roadblock/LC7 domain-containing protein n=1 Tax=Streptomyces litchfieldiae TaxID=3075543 RepID=A0ABU2MSJ9_9ACTN|nr:roadblock/LC7 domain-containing protein [Streptomyces sp. DSM 44938]MDT0344606.1 roadblock/LC7 domain-containing protein [Streptomyces sp. DSM 44938]
MNEKQVTQRRVSGLDWMLRDLAATVPCVQHIVVLSSDGLCIAQHGDRRDSSERLAAAASGVKSLAQSIAGEFARRPEPDEGEIRMVLMELNGGFFYLMSAGARSYLAVTTTDEVDPGMVGNRMRDLVQRIGDHLSTGARTPEQAAP